MLPEGPGLWEQRHASRRVAGILSRCVFSVNVCMISDLERSGFRFLSRDACGPFSGVDGLCVNDIQKFGFRAIRDGWTSLRSKNMWFFV